MNFNDIVAKMSDIYNSIDIRLVSVLHDGVWKCPYIAVRFRHEKVDDVKNEQSDLVSKIGKIDNDKIRIRLYSFSMSFWEKISNSWIQHASVTLEDSFAVNFLKTSQLPNSEISSPSYCSEDHLISEWNSFHVAHTRDDSFLAKLREFDKEAIKLNFRNIREYIAIALRIDPQKVDGGNTYLLLNAPVFFKINDNGIIFSKEKISILGKGLPMGSLNISINLYNTRHGSNRYSWRDRIQLVHNLNGTNTHPEKFEIKGKIPSLTVNDAFEITVHRENGLMIYDKSTTEVGYYWPEKSIHTNPIFPIFSKFVEYNELEKMLFKAKDRKDKQSSVNFEKGCTWLLGLLGFNPIWLGNDFQYTGTGPQKISIDIICHYKNKILLVNPTMGVPDTSAFARERKYRENILQIMTDSKVETSSIIITNASIQTLKDKASENDIRLIGNDELKIILGYLKSGDINDARNMLVPDFGF